MADQEDSGVYVANPSYSIRRFHQKGDLGTIGLKGSLVPLPPPIRTVLFNVGSGTGGTIAFTPHPARARSMYVRNISGQTVNLVLGVADNLIGHGDTAGFYNANFGTGANYWVNPLEDYPSVLVAAGDVTAQWSAPAALINEFTVILYEQP